MGHCPLPSHPSIPKSRRTTFWIVLTVFCLGLALVVTLSPGEPPLQPWPAPLVILFFWFVCFTFMPGPHQRPPLPEGRCPRRIRRTEGQPCRAAAQPGRARPAGSVPCGRPRGHDRARRADPVQPRHRLHAARCGGGHHKHAGGAAVIHATPGSQARSNGADRRIASPTRRRRRLSVLAVGTHAEGRRRDAGTTHVADRPKRGMSPRYRRRWNPEQESWMNRPIGRDDVVPDTR